jgi:hypothetical protein
MTVAAHAAPRSRNPFAGLGAYTSRRVARAKAALGGTARTLRRRSPGIRSAVLQIGGLAGFTATAWSAHPLAGGAVGSTALFVLNWLLTDPGPGPGERR